MSILKRIKRENYELLLHKNSNAIENEFYFEAIWISYCIMEDRLLSALKKCKCDKTISKKGKAEEIRMLGPKIKAIRSNKISQPLLQLIEIQLIDNIEKWKDVRNDLMHKLATESAPLRSFDATIQKCARDGITLAKDLAASIQRINKQLKRKARKDTKINP